MRRVLGVLLWLPLRLLEWAAGRLLAGVEAGPVHYAEPRVTAPGAPPVPPATGAGT